MSNEAKPKYWRDTQVHKLAQAASSALFDIHRDLKDVWQDEDWREVYGLRCTLGKVEQHKDKHITTPPAPEAKK